MTWDRARRVRIRLGDLSLELLNFDLQIRDKLLLRIQLYRGSASYCASRASVLQCACHRWWFDRALRHPHQTCKPTVECGSSTRGARPLARARIDSSA